MYGSLSKANVFQKCFKLQAHVARNAINGYSLVGVSFEKLCVSVPF